ncbi:alpha/beta hydrolase [Leifsonia sp. ku-ls]|nr:alpha/beta hydrolase [Leifsonia sp. ku-ls]
MIWIIVILAILVVLALALGALTILLARRVVMPGSPRVITIHETGDGTVTLQNDGKTDHAGQFGLWFGQDGHALIGPVLSRDPAAGTVTRQILTVTAGKLAAGEGRWTGHVFPHPRALERSVEDVDVSVAGGDAPAWLIRPQHPVRPETWAIHIHGVRTTRITALRSVPAADVLGYTSLVVSFRGDTEGPEVLNGASTLGLGEWPDVDAAIAYALAHGAQRVVLFAWSMGASIALQLTEHSAHRDAIAGLVLIAPATDWRTAIRHGAQKAHLPRVLGSAAIHALQGRLSSRIVGLPFPIDFDALDFTRFARLSVPALVIHSDGDQEIPVELSRRFAAAHPGVVTLTEFPGAAHAWEYNVDAAGFNAAIVAWCQQQLTR